MKFRDRTALFVIALAFTASGKAQAQKDADTSNQYCFGNFLSYKWVAEEVTELTEKQANSFLKKGMKIDTAIFFIFDDTVHSPTYKISKIDKISFFRAYTVDYRNFKQLSDPLTVLYVLKDHDYEDEGIIIAGNDLIANYRGCFYYFKRKSSHSRSR